MTNGKPLDGYKILHGKLNNIIAPATFRRGIIVAIHAASMTADVQLIGNNASIIKNVPISSAINLTTTKSGMKCRVDIFNETNINDSVVAYTYS